VFRRKGFMVQSTDRQERSAALNYTGQTSSPDEKLFTGLHSERAVHDTTITSAIPPESRCICDSSTELARSESFHVSRDDLDRCAKHIRALLNIVEDARSANDGTGRCEIVAKSYKESLSALHAITPTAPRKASRLRRLFSKAPS